MGPITDTHRLTFKMNMDLALQQTKSKLDAAYMYETGLSGKKMQMLELFGSHSAVKNLGRKADTPDIDNPVEPVWLSPTQLADGHLMELEDVIKRTQDPQSMFIKTMAAAMVRGKDEVLAAATFGARQIGADGATTSAWAGDTVAVGVGHADGVTAIGMTVDKIKRGIRYLQQRFVDIDTEQLFLKLNAQGMEELYNDIEFINTDYRGNSVLEGKQVRQIMGVTIIPADGSAAEANYDGSTYTFAMWAKSGLVWGEFSPLRTDIPLRPDKLMRPHPQMEQWLGATRTEDYKVVKILSKIA